MKRISPSLRTSNPGGVGQAFRAVREKAFYVSSRTLDVDARRKLAAASKAAPSKAPQVPHNDVQHTTLPQKILLSIIYMQDFPGDQQHNRKPFLKTGRSKQGSIQGQGGPGTLVSRRLPGRQGLRWAGVPRDAGSGASGHGVWGLSVLGFGAWMFLWFEGCKLCLGIQGFWDLGF